MEYMIQALIGILAFCGVVIAALLVLVRRGSDPPSATESFPTGLMARREDYIDRLLTRVEGTEHEHSKMIDALDRIVQVSEKTRDAISEIHLAIVKINGRRSS